MIKYAVPSLIRIRQKVIPCSRPGVDVQNYEGCIDHSVKRNANKLYAAAELSWVYFLKPSSTQPTKVHTQPNPTVKSKR